MAIIKYLPLCFLLLTGVNAVANEKEKDKVGPEKGSVNKLSPAKAPAPVWSPEMLSNVVIPETPLAQEDLLLIDSAKTVFEQITRNGSWVNLLTDNASVKFPFGMLKKTPNYSTIYQLAFSSVSITKSGAVARVFGRMLLNGSQNSAIYFQGYVNLSRIGGAGSGNKLTLIGDQTVNNSVDWSFILNGGGATSPTTMSFDCNGFVGLDINGFVTLNKDKYKPVATSGGTSGEDQMKSKISVTGLTKWEDLYIERLQFSGYFTAASLPLLQGYAFRISEATLDMNDNKSPSTGDLGTYISKDNAKPGLWRGLAITKMDISLPGYFSTGKKTSRSVGIKYGVIDDNGFSFSVDATNVLDFSNGSANGWDMSVTKLNLSVLKGAFTGGSFSGKLVLPIEDPGYNGKGIPFETTINDDGSMETAQGNGDIPYITMKPWYGFIHPENIDIAMDIDLERNKLLPKITLSGKFDFSMSGEEVPYIPTKKEEARNRKANFGADDIELEGMVLQTEGSYLTIGSLGTSRELTLGGFSAIVAVEYRNTGPEDASDASTAQYACLHFDANLQLGGGKVSGGAMFDLYMKYDTANKKWQYVAYHISKVKVGYEGGKVKFKGEINYMKDKTYGVAYGGTISVTILDKMEMGASVLFGHKTSPNGSIYDYYNVDAMAKGVKYKINPYLTITGFSGGITYHMDPVTPDGEMPVSLSGISYKPNDQSFLRVRAGVYFEVVKERLMTGWGGLEIAFNKNYGIDEVSISGRAQIFSKPDGVIKKPEVNPIKKGEDKNTAKGGGSKSKKEEKKEAEDDEDQAAPLADKLARYSGGKQDAAEASGQSTISGTGEAASGTTPTKIETIFPANKYDLPAKYDSVTLIRLKLRYAINKPIYDRAIAVLDSMEWIGVTIGNTYRRLKESSKKWDPRFDTHPYVQFENSHAAYSKLVDNTANWKEVCSRLKLPYMITHLSPDPNFTYENTYVIPTPAKVEAEARVAPKEIAPLLLFKAENSSEYGVITVARLLVPYYNDVFDFNTKRLDSADKYEGLYNYWINEVGMPPYGRVSGDFVRTQGILKGNADLRNAYRDAARLAGNSYASLRGSSTIMVDTSATPGGAYVRDSLYTYEGMVALNTIVYDLAVKARPARIKQDGGLTLSAGELAAIEASDVANEKYAPFIKEANRIRAVKQQKTLYDDVVMKATLTRVINSTTDATTRTNLKSQLEILDTKIAQEGNTLSRGELLFNPSKEQMNYLEKNYAKNKNSDTLAGLQMLRKPVDISPQVAVDMVVYDDLKNGTKPDEKSAFSEMDTRKVQVGVALALLGIANNELRTAAEAAEAAKEAKKETTTDKLGGAVLAAYARPDGDPIVWGDFTAKMDIANNTFSFVLQAYVAVEEAGQSVIEGSGENFRAGLAEIYISGSTFKINVGTQEDPCGVTIHPPKIKFLNAAASFYLQVTNAKGDDGSDFSVKAGVSAGMAFVFKAAVGGFGVYAYLNGKLGFDLGLKHFDNFTCSGTSGGFQGWYGKGTIYASFGGSAGLVVLGENVEILSGSISTTLTVTGPAPLYVAGKIRFDYNVLGYGSGTKEISMDSGTKCDNIKF